MCIKVGFSFIHHPSLKVFYLLLINFSSIAWANNIVIGSGGSKLEGKVFSEFTKPWAMSFINKDTLLITTKVGKLWLVDRSGEKSLVSGVPKNPAKFDSWLASNYNQKPIYRRTLMPN